MEAYQLSMFSSEASREGPARTYRWLDAALDWLANGAACSLSSHAALKPLLLNGSLSKTSPDSCPPTGVGTWLPSSGRWANSGMGGPTGCLTLSTTTWHSGASVCSLSDVVEDERDVPRKYYLSPKACAGILRRAERRGKALPAPLEAALRAAIQNSTATGHT